MAEQNQRLAKFVADQEAAVGIARDILEQRESTPSRVDAINVALSLAHANSELTTTILTMSDLIRDARKAEA